MLMELSKFIGSPGEFVWEWVNVNCKVDVCCTNTDAVSVEIVARASSTWIFMYIHSEFVKKGTTFVWLEDFKSDLISKLFKS